MKNLLRISLGVVLVGGTVALVVPEEANGFSVIGGNLGLTQRDFRIYDNFIDAASHNNTQPHPNWPGFTEIELSCWKAGAEWGGRVFGDGTGDSSQYQVGDGRSNFNFVWNGEASGVGGYNANILSPISGSSGGVLAYTETPISDGWRIRFYESWTWADGPDGNLLSGEMDFQGIAAHELGHALGLGHSGDPVATMYAYANGNGVPDRSIEQDDRDGVIYIYGARDNAINPWIDNVGGSLTAGGTCVLTGGNYSTTGNEIWLNSSVISSSNTGGEPYKILNVASTNGGTQISFTVPSSGILAGAVHVKRSGGTSHKYLGEGNPFDFGGGGNTNQIALSGPTSAAAGSTAIFDFTGAGANQPTYLLWSLSNAGTTIQGHPFDIGDPWHIGSIATSDAAGAGSWTVQVPPTAAGATVYLEVGQSDNGTILDSNMLTLSIY